MTRSPLVSLFALAVAILGPNGVVAEETTEQNPARDTSAVAGTKSVPTSAARMMSSEMAEHLAAVAPKYTPPPAAAKVVARSDETNPAEAAGHEADKPRNTIIRLPDYIVSEPRLPRLRPREMLTPQGKIDIALKRHPGLKFGPFAFLNNGIALAMYEEEERLERLQEANDMLSLMRMTKDPLYGKMKDAVNDSFLRHDF